MPISPYHELRQREGIENADLARAQRSERDDLNAEIARMKSALAAKHAEQKSALRNRHGDALTAYRDKVIADKQAQNISNIPLVPGRRRPEKPLQERIDDLREALRMSAQSIPLWEADGIDVTSDRAAHAKLQAELAALEAQVRK